MTDPSLLIFKHGDGWVKREGGVRWGEGAGDGKQTGRAREDDKMAEESFSCGVE